MTSASARAAEMAARASYGKLLAIVAARTGDVASAEDALAEAFARALETWPRDGVPENPDAWLLTTARNRLTDIERKAARIDVTQDVPDMPQNQDTSPPPLPDRRLALMCVCTHPAIAPDLHAPLMLQTVLGVDAKGIARAFLDSPTALAQRLVRAKRKIKDARIPFVVPDLAQLGPRLTALLESIYALHALDWLDPSDDMGHEAMFLADLIARERPMLPEARGLAALIALGHARRDARLADGALVPVPDQDTTLWDHSLIRYGLRHLAIAQSHRQPGRFQIEAAIQAAHIHRHDTGQTDWRAILALYDGLWALTPTLGVAVARTAALAHVEGPSAALAVLNNIQNTDRFQPAHATRADLLAQLGDKAAARTAYDKAISLTTEAALRTYLITKRNRL